MHYDAWSAYIRILHHTYLAPCVLFVPACGPDTAVLLQYEDRQQWVSLASGMLGTALRWAALHQLCAVCFALHQARSVL